MNWNDHCHMLKTLFLKALPEIALQTTGYNELMYPKLGNRNSGKIKHPSEDGCAYRCLDEILKYPFGLMNLRHTPASM